MKKRIIAFCILFGLLVVLTGCEKKGLEAGFDSAGGDPVSEYFCAYKSDSNTFVSNEVMLSFFYGATDLPDMIEDETIVHRLYFTTESILPGGKIHDGSSHFIKELTQFPMDIYGVDLSYKKGKITRITFKFSETLSIPSELFNQEKGVIYFTIVQFATYQDGRDETYEGGGDIAIYYKKKGDKITLSSKN